MIDDYRRNYLPYTCNVNCVTLTNSTLLDWCNNLSHLFFVVMRGFMTHKGVPDFPRSARCILKDYVNVSLSLPRGL